MLIPPKLTFDVTKPLRLNNPHSESHEPLRRIRYHLAIFREGAVIIGLGPVIVLEQNIADNNNDFDNGAGKEGEEETENKCCVGIEWIAIQKDDKKSQPILHTYSFVRSAIIGMFSFLN